MDEVGQIWQPPIEIPLNDSTVKDDTKKLEPDIGGWLGS